MVATLRKCSDETNIFLAKMIKHMRALPPEDLGIVLNLNATCMKDRKSLRSAEAMLQFAAANGPPSNEIFEWSKGSLFTFPYKNETTHIVCLKCILVSFQRSYRPADSSCPSDQSRRSWIAVKHWPKETTGNSIFSSGKACHRPISKKSSKIIRRSA
ncbi:hypothetical protein J3R30DRAFT_1581100 [Lentinula aciculospora]|uniref:Uncharacterized protein n=1 Tax=Lentinula aciculospora TaxID=153920 RepID=A0A9W8ZZ46_9AGAR|nr:hypothetical protein J3R30DRAFT_1581100 [Lentinula aciculospora]